MNSSEQVSTAVTTMMGYVSSGIVDNKPTCIEKMTMLANGLVGALTDTYSTYYSVGSMLFLYLTNGMKSKDSDVKSVSIQSVNDAASALKNKYKDFYSAGSYLVQGFIDGIANNIQAAAN